MAFIRRIQEHVRRNGAAQTLRRGIDRLGQRVLHTWERQARRLDPTAEELVAQRAAQPEAGLISVAVPVFNTRPRYLRELAASLTAQTYANWEAILLDGGSTDTETIRALEALSGDERIRVIHEAENLGISGNTNAAVRHCQGAYIALCDHDDTLSPEALWQVAWVIADEAPDLLYTDEDRLTENGRLRIEPHRKPDLSPDTLRSGNYICHLMVIRRELLETLGGLRPAFDGSQDHDLALRITERTEAVRHISKVLYHWRRAGTSMSRQHLQKCQDAAARAVTEHMARMGWPGTCTVEDGALRLRYEIRPGLAVATLRVSANLSEVERWAWMNRAAASAKEAVLLFVDAAVIGLSEDFVRELLMYAQRDDVGAAAPLMTKRRRSVAGGVVMNVPTVSAACFMIRRDHFIPFDEGRTEGSVMADWCRKLREMGMWCVVTPHAQAIFRKIR